MSANFNPVLIILAAGQSSRFNGIKQLAKVDTEQGKQVLMQYQYNKFKQLEWPILIATGDYHPGLLKLDIEPQLLRYCDKANLGMGHSISQISEMAYELHQPTHLVFILADQVALANDDLIGLLSTAKSSPNKIITCQTTLGLTAPTIFPVRFLPELIALTGDKGAKSIIKKHIYETQAVQLDNAQVDIDTQEDLSTWNKASQAEASNDQVTN